MSFKIESLLDSLTQPVALACSGGVDSMVLAHVLHKTGFLAAILHVQFGLRPEAWKEEKMLQDWTKKQNIPLYIKHLNTQEYATEKKISIQMAARYLRYQWFEEWHKEHQISIALAHHADDQAETIFYNLLRNRDFAVLQGIPFQRDFYIRPFLYIRKKDIIQYAHENYVIWIEDASNQKKDYFRNKIRHTLLNSLEDIQPNIPFFLQERMNLYQKQLAVLDIFLEKQKKYWLVEQEERYFIYIPFIEQLNTTDKEIYIRWFSDKYLHLSEKETQEWITHFHAKTGGKIPTQTKLIIRDRHFWVAQYPKAIPEPLQLKIGVQEWGSYQIELSEKEISSYSIQIPAEEIQGKLNIRAWKLEDYIVPKGFKGRKKISDILTNIKFPSWLKPEAFVLVDDCQVFMTEDFKPKGFLSLTDKEKYIYVRFTRIKNFYPISKPEPTTHTFDCQNLD